LWRGCPDDSGQAVGAAAKEIEETEIPEDLELLADFVADVHVSVVRIGRIYYDLCCGKERRLYCSCLRDVFRALGDSVPRARLVDWTA
jgi:hypothetical protein